MSGSLNRAFLIGNLGQDPIVKVTPNGQTVARFSLATTESWKDPKGEKHTKTEWHTISVWGSLADVASKYLQKGKQVYVEGRIQYGEYTDKEGQKKQATSIRADKLILLGAGHPEGGSRQENVKGSGDDAYRDDPSQQAGSASTNYDDDIPF